jgi:hypothetical protein
VTPFFTVRHRNERRSIHRHRHFKWEPLLKFVDSIFNVVRFNKYCYIVLILACVHRVMGEKHILCCIYLRVVYLS